MDIKALQRICGDGGWLAADDAAAAPWLVDERGLYEGRAALVALPRDTATLAALLRHCHEQCIAVVPQGGNTGYVGGATPSATGEQVLLRLDRIAGVCALDACNATLTVAAGCTLAAAREAAHAQQMCLPLSLGSEGSCTIGGVLSSNAGGVRVVRYGNARDLCLGLEVVLADGRVLSQLNTVRKSNTGYDLKQLFIGAEGTLGVITAAVLRLFPVAARTVTSVATTPGVEAAVRVYERCRAALGARLAGFEYMDGSCLQSVFKRVAGVRNPFPSSAVAAACILIEAEAEAGAGIEAGAGAETGDGLEQQLTMLLASCHETGLLSDAVVAANAAQARQLWRLREAVPEAQKRAGGSLKHDISVPLSAWCDFMGAARRLVAKHCAEAVVEAFGHLGDGNLHFNVRLPQTMANPQALSGDLYDLVMAHHGSFSAEHGIGQLRKQDLLRYQPPPALALMRDLKRVLDPHCILNPGKVIDLV